ncbi:MAG: serine hydrolase domain-containing protein [Bacteroidota bacterium]
MQKRDCKIDLPKIFLYLVWMLLVQCSTFVSLHAQYIDLFQLEQRLDSIVEAGRLEGAYPGAQLYIARAGKVLLHKTYGFHTYAQKQAVQKNDLYDLASITKVSSGLPLLMKLYGEGKFDLDAPLRRYLPSFRKSNKANLSFREMLSHQARLKPYIVYWQNCLKEDKSFKRNTFKHQYSKKYSIKITDNLYLHRRYYKKMYRAIRDSPLEAQVKYKYSGLLFLLLPKIIENISGEDFEDYLRKEILDPIGAKALLYNPSSVYPLDRIVPTERDTFFRKQLVHGHVHDEAAAMLDGVSCNAGLFGTAKDLAKLFQLYLDDGQYEGRQLISAAAVRAFTQRHYSEHNNRRGLGFDKPLIEYDPIAAYVARDAPPESYGHSGFTGTFVWADPVHDLLLVFLSNRVHPYRSSRNLYKLGIRPALHQAIYDAFHR